MGPHPIFESGKDTPIIHVTQIDQGKS